MEDLIKEVCDKFRIPGEFSHYEQLKIGNVNKTYRVYFLEPTKSYILQKVNTFAFRKPIELMENIDKVTEFIRNKYPDRKALHFHHTAEVGRPDRKTYFYTDDGSFWRLFNFIDSDTYNSVADLKIVRKAGEAFGEFQMSLSDFDPSTLYYTIPDFHNTPKRYEALEEAVNADKAGRVKEVREELDWLFSVKEKACALQKADLPIRVTHNDTKINNVLFDKQTHDAIVVIDLDTVMPGLVAHDFGDAIRSAANQVAEDSNEYDKVGINMDIFQAFSEGFLSEVGSILNKEELETLAISPFILSTELAARFLTDYLNGDKYFNIAYPDHNLVRTKNQISLAKDMLKHELEMEWIIKEITEI